MESYRAFGLGLVLASALFLTFLLPGIMATAKVGIDNYIEARVQLAMRAQVDRIYDDLETLHPTRVYRTQRGAPYVR